MGLAPKNQATKSTMDFLAKMPRIVVGLRRTSPNPPEVPLVIRIGAAGHLNIEHEASIAFALDHIFSSLNEYASKINGSFNESMFRRTEAVPAPHLRLVSQLAPGLDQIAAKIALDKQFQLDVVLPGTRTAFEKDIIRNMVLTIGRHDQGSRETKSDPLSEFRSLMKSARRILELDHVGDAAQSSELVSADYEQASSIILNNCDLLLVAIHEDASASPGGTKWIADQAERLEVPIIRIPVDRPSDAIFIWTDGRRRESRQLFEGPNSGLNAPLFDAALTETLVGFDTNVKHIELGWFERGFVAQMKPQFNEALWDDRWKCRSNSALAEHSLGSARNDIDNDLKSAKSWTDYRASAMAEIARGSFIFCAALSVLAVLGALAGLLIPDIARSGKILELGCLGVVLWFIRRSRQFSWRSQWLSMRETERCLDQAGWLFTLGRTRSYRSAAHLKHLNFDSVSEWCTSYLRAVLRHSSFPTAKLNSDYLKAIHTLAIENLVGSQIKYFSDEAAFHSRADEYLEKWANRSIVLAAVSTALYLIVYSGFLMSEVLKLPWLAPFCHIMYDPEFHHELSLKVAVFGAFLPSVATALSAIRQNGEYAQISARYRSIARTLSQDCDELKFLLSDHRRSLPWCRSVVLARIFLKATDDLLREVQGWSGILRKKEIEAS